MRSLIFLFALAGFLRADLDDLDPQPLTDKSITPMTVTIPAPRGQILDRTGEAFATTKVVEELTLGLPKLADETSASFSARVFAVLESLPADLKARLVLPDTDSLAAHFEHRRSVPIVISEPLDPVADAKLIDSAKKASLGSRSRYLRSYPGGTLASHLIGHLGVSSPPIEGPISQRENFWQKFSGKAGLEQLYNETLKGKDGLMVLAYDENTRQITREVLEGPEAGNNVVLTLNAHLQRVAESALKRSGRPGAFVLMDSDAGDILAMASFPGFDPNMFVPGISTKDYEAVRDDPRAPLFERAAGAAYPPGSVFKPLAGLAMLDSRLINGRDLVMCEPEYEVDGRIFRNWSDTDRGRINLRGALVRSCNTYFYQTGVHTHPKAFIKTAHDFGLGESLFNELPFAVPGNLPPSAPSSHGLANLSIGQGEVLTTPLQIANMMGGFGNGRRLPAPRLTLQTQEPGGKLLAKSTIGTGGRLPYSRDHIRYIRSGLFGVVNHERGTAKAARMSHIPVYGKTGTAEWSNRGAMASVVWFTGFVDTCTPPISFAVALEGKPGEKIYGGSTAAPVVGRILSEVFRDSEKSGIRAARRQTKIPVLDYPLFIEEVIPQAVPVAVPVAAPVYPTIVR